VQQAICCPVPASPAIRAYRSPPLAVGLRHHVQEVQWHIELVWPATLGYGPLAIPAALAVVTYQVANNKSLAADYLVGATGVFDVLADTPEGITPKVMSNDIVVGVGVMQFARIIETVARLPGGSESVHAIRLGIEPFAAGRPPRGH
jgi:hypothetical protein